MSNNQLPDRPTQPSFDPYAVPGQNAPSSWAPSRPGNGPIPPQGPPLGTPLPPPMVPCWQRDGMVSRVLVVAGVAVTLIGVVMLLVLAARAGLLGPQVRVAGGAALCAALVAAGWRAFDRTGGRVGGIALAGTGIAGFFMVAVAMTSIYHWLPSSAGLALAGVVAAGSVALAMRWNSQMLAVLVTASVAALSPVLTSGLTVTLIGFLLLLQAAGVVPESLRTWPVLCAVRTVPVVLAILLTRVDPHHFSFRLTLTAAVAVALIGMVSGLLASHRALEELTGAMYLTAFVPVFAIVPATDRPAGVLLASVLAGGTVIGAIVTRPLGPVTSGMTAIIAAVLVFEAAFAVTTGGWLPVILLALAMTVGVAVHQSHSLVATWAAFSFFAVGVCYFGYLVQPASLTVADQAVKQLSIASAVAGLLVVVGAGLYAVTFNRVVPSLPSGVLIGLAGLVGGYGLTAAIIAAGATAGGDEGFRAGHFLVTMTWMSIAMTMLALGLKHRQHAKAALSTGLAVVAISLAKLFVFDLATLSGMSRAGAFIVVGLLLLFAGSRYAQATASRQHGHA
ncbi:DUF2339 domain-containing protein [Leekyejoonella antrihumi]|uniref:DUF2339 domain-containing protein n=1 Tax=Leekyejoonella antrihumi TaxID=1660198 RepID=A0A563E904_9MICO|nr:DUF2339 domain-containing protein [Leekyejoonella antrihumi]TWP38996.1 DUF2339 domain-containing protein [Leekyejoonella antrihumi]